MSKELTEEEMLEEALKDPKIREIWGALRDMFPEAAAECVERQAQDLAPVHLMGLARTGKIKIAVSEYSFHEADGSPNRKHNKRAYKVDDALSVLGQIGLGV